MLTRFSDFRSRMIIFQVSIFVFYPKCFIGQVLASFNPSIQNSFSSPSSTFKFHRHLGHNQRNYFSVQSIHHVRSRVEVHQSTTRSPHLNPLQHPQSHVQTVIPNPNPPMSPPLQRSHSRSLHSLVPQTHLYWTQKPRRTTQLRLIDQVISHSCSPRVRQERRPPLSKSTKSLNRPLQ